MNERRGCQRISALAPRQRPQRRRGLRCVPISSNRLRAGQLSVNVLLASVKYFLTGEVLMSTFKFAIARVIQRLHGRDAASGYLWT